MEPYLGQIMMFAGNFPPRGWAFCDGQLLSINSNSALFSILGTTYGGDGRSTFGLPNMKGRVPVHPGTGPGLSPYQQGPGGGREQETLTVNNMPSHTHAVASGKLKGSFTPPTGGGTLTNPNGAYLSGDGSPMYSNSAPNVELGDGSVDVTLANTGGGQGFGIVQPWCGVQFIIATEGLFPPRS